MMFSPARNIEAIERFLDAYVDRTASEDRGDEERAMLALDPSGRPTSGDKWDWESSKTLTHIVERGLQFPRRAFSDYLKPRDVSLARATLAFDVDEIPDLLQTSGPFRAAGSWLVPDSSVVRLHRPSTHQKSPDLDLRTGAKLLRNSAGIAFETVERHLSVLSDFDEIAVGITHVATPFPAVVV
jgi:hypothetical protein